MQFLPHSPTKTSEVIDAIKISIKTNKTLGNNVTVITQDLVTIGKLITDTGVSKIFVDTKEILKGTSNQIMAGKGFYKAMNAHLQLYEAMLALWWQSFEDWALKDEKDVTIISDIGKLLEEFKLLSKDNAERSRRLVTLIDGKLMEL